MIKTSVSGLKAKLGRYMKAVREGKEVLVTDRDRPVARLGPLAPPTTTLRVSRPRDPAAPPLGKVRVAGLRVRGIDTTAMLREERDRR